jgi:hypothetical protein
LSRSAVVEYPLDDAPHDAEPRYSVSWGDGYVSIRKPTERPSTQGHIWLDLSTQSGDTDGFRRGAPALRLIADSVVAVKVGAVKYDNTSYTIFR